MMSLPEQLLIILALCTLSFSYGQTSNVFHCTTMKDDLIISATMALFQGVFVMLGMVLGRWIIGFAGSMGFALGVGTMALVGIRMIMDARKGEPDDRAFKLNDRVMIFAMSLAASINGFILALGLPAFIENIPLFSSMALIATFLITFAGIKSGKRSGNFKIGKYAVIIGGTVIITVTAVQVYLSYFA